jgi:hypothetical protein
MSRRMSLPGADELFRATVGAPARDQGDGEPLRAVPDAADDEDPGRARRARRLEARRTTGRERHDEKFTVYVSQAELMDLEHARLALRGEHGMVVDRGRIVREALALVVEDFEARGEDSVLVRRLRYQAGR